MYYLDECEQCDRHGYVALEQSDKVCNLCKHQTVTTRVKMTVKKKDEDKEKETIQEGNS